MSARDEVRGDDWARALGAVPSGLFVATSGFGEEQTGFLVSFVQQVGFEPPCLALAVKRGRPIEDVVRRSGAFCLSILDERSRHLMGHFARGFALGDPAFDGVDVDLAPSGLPFAREALAWVDCRVIGEAAWSDHVVFCGEVFAGFRRSEGAPLVHVRKTGMSY